MYLNEIKNIVCYVEGIASNLYSVIYQLKSQKKTSLGLVKP